MADVDTGDVLRLGCIWLLDGVFEIANVFHTRVVSGGGLDFSDAADDLAEYANDIYTEIRVRMTDTMATHLLTLQNITQVTTFGAFSWATPLAGGDVGEHTAMGVCCLTWARTFKPRVQIRKYWGVFTEAMIADGTWSATLLNDCLDAMAIHTAEFVGTNGLTVQGVAYNRTLETTTDPTSVTGTAEPAYQRRRKRGRGS